jgi:hypothetical protein
LIGAVAAGQDDRKSACDQLIQARHMVGVTMR